MFERLYESSQVQFSIVVPIFNEAENIEAIAREVAAVFDGIEGPCELVFVDDASTDHSMVILEQLSAEFPEIRVVRHRLNCGQSAAVASGLRGARGRWIGTIDGDGQNDPADFPEMLEAAERLQADCVTGVRTNRKDTRVKKIASKLGNRFRDWATGDRVSDSACGIRVLRSACVGELPVFNGLHRFMPTILRAQGFKVEEIPVNHRPRMHGVSKYGVNNRLWRGIRDCFGVRWYVRRAVRAQRVHKL